MKYQKLLLVVAAIAAFEAQAQGKTNPPVRPVQATCTQASGETKLSGVTVGHVQNPAAITIQSGDTRSLDLADIEWIDVTGPVNRITRTAWATIKTTNAEPKPMSIFLPTLDRTLELDGTTPQGKQGNIDVLSCKKIVFKAGT